MTTATRTAPKELLEISPIELVGKPEILENDKTYLMRVRSVSQHADKKNANGRIYPYAILEREVKRIQNEIRDNPGSVLEQGDHPEGLPSIRGVAAVLESIDIDSTSKRVITTSRILKTEIGKDVAAILEGGGKVGRSSRGFGSVEHGEVLGETGDVVQDDYRLATTDFVIGQSTADAYVNQVLENSRKGGGDEMELKDLTLESLRTGRPELVTQIETTAKTAAETAAKATLETKIAENTTEVEKRVVGEAMTKPASISQEAWDKMSIGEKKKAWEEEQANEQNVRARADKLGFALVSKNDATALSKVESDLSATKTKLQEATATITTIQEGQKRIEERELRVSLRESALTATKEEKKYRTAIVEALNAAIEKGDVKTVDEVKARIPVERAKIERLLETSGGGNGKGDPGDREEQGSGNRGERSKYKSAAGAVLELTEQEARMRANAGYQDALVEA